VASDFAALEWRAVRPKPMADRRKRSGTESRSVALFIIVELRVDET